jgi:hypothetical protein
MRDGGSILFRILREVWQQGKGVSILEEGRAMNDGVPGVCFGYIFLYSSYTVVLCYQSAALL